MPTIITNDNIKQLVKHYVSGNKNRRLPEDMRNIPIGNWDVSRVTNMESLFSGCKRFNEDINDWDVSNVTNMNKMFLDCVIFDKPLYKWIVSKVEKMERMFEFCYEFNQELNDWDVSNVEKMGFMFFYCYKFNKPLNDWDVSNVRDMSYMFDECRRFNQPLDKWYVSNVTNMERMFYFCTDFNQDLSSWDVFNVEDMTYMFNYCQNLKINPNWRVNEKTQTYNTILSIENPIDMFSMSPLSGTVLEKTRYRYDERKADKDLKNTIAALSEMRDKTKKRIPIPSGDMIRKITDYIDPDRISKTGKKDIEQEIWKERERKVYTNPRRETRREEHPGGGGYAGGRSKRKGVGKRKRVKVTERRRW